MEIGAVWWRNQCIGEERVSESDRWVVSPYDARDHSSSHIDSMPHSNPFREVSSEEQAHANVATGTN